MIPSTQQKGRAMDDQEAERQSESPAVTPTKSSGFSARAVGSSQAKRGWSTVSDQVCQGGAGSHRDFTSAKPTEDCWQHCLCLQKADISREHQLEVPEQQRKGTILPFLFSPSNSLSLALENQVGIRKIISRCLFYGSCKTKQKTKNTS